MVVFVTRQVDEDIDMLANAAVNDNVNGVANANRETNTNVAVNSNNDINTGIDTSGWHTYDNDDLGFQIKRPPQWLWQGHQSGSIITKFFSSQEEMPHLCQLEIYEGSADVSDISYQEDNSSSVMIGDSSITRLNYVDGSNEIRIFTTEVTNGNTTIGFKAQIGQMFINVEELTCTEYLTATLESFTFYQE